jgi:anti-anti-sigma regulatory factor
MHSAVTISARTGGVSVPLCGELDMAAVPAVRHRLCGLDGDIDLDCSELTFIDAFVRRLFVAVHRACEARRRDAHRDDAGPAAA